MALVPTRSETAANWASFTGTLANGEVVIETDTGVVKVGDGITLYAQLPVAANQETSADERATTSDETGTGVAVFATSPTLTTPIIAGGTATSLNLVTPIFTVADAITASATQTQVAATALTKDINRVVTVASADDAVKLPAATAGAKVVVINAHATNGIGVFPASGDKVDALSTDAVYALAATKTAMFFCAVAGQWNTILTA